MHEGGARPDPVEKILGKELLDLTKVGLQRGCVGRRHCHEHRVEIDALSDMTERHESGQISTRAAACIKDQGADRKRCGKSLDTVEHLRAMACFVLVGVLAIGGNRNDDGVVASGIRRHGTHCPSSGQIVPHPGYRHP